MIVRGFIILFCLFLLNPSSGQSLSDTIHIHEVKIISSEPLWNAGLQVTRVDSLALEETNNNSMANLLANHTPIFIKTYGQGGVATASFRGTAASHTQVQWNGMNINSPMLGQVDFSLIPVFFIDDIQLYPGGSSLNNCSGGLGGSVSINNLPDWNNQFDLSLSTKYGSLHQTQSFLKIGAGNRKLQFRVRSFYEYAKNDFKFYSQEDKRWQKQENAEYTRLGTMAEFYARIKQRHYLSIIGWGNKAARNIPPLSNFSALHHDEYQDDMDLRANLQWKTLLPKLKIFFNSGLAYNHINYFAGDSIISKQDEWGNPVNTFYKVNHDAINTYYSFSNQVSSTYSFSKKWVFEYSIYSNYHDVSSKDLIPRTDTWAGHRIVYTKNRMESGAKVSLGSQLSDRLSGNFMVKKDLVDKKWIPIIPFLGLKFDCSREKDGHFYIKTTLTRNYHWPTLNDLYWQPGGNDTLKPENGYSGDMSIHYSGQFGKLDYHASLNSYASIIDNWIIWMPGDFVYWNANNLKKVFARGMETFIKISTREFPVNITMQGMYAYTKTTNLASVMNNDNSLGKQLVYIPVHSANMLFKAERKGYSILYTGYFTGKRFTSTGNDRNHALPAYYLASISLEKKIRKKENTFSFSFSINNLFNVSYIAIRERPMPGIHYHLSLKVDFNKTRP